jgi:hypothetical protein
MTRHELAATEHSFFLFLFLFLLSVLFLWASI